jgi:hypothetical protein
VPTWCTLNFWSRTTRVLSVIWHLLYISVMPDGITSDWAPTVTLWRDCIFFFLPQESYRTNWIPFLSRRIYRAVNKINLRIFELCWEKEVKILDFKLSPCSEGCILSFGWFCGAWILYANVSEHSLNSIVIGGVGRKNYSCLHQLRRWNWHSVLNFLLTQPMKMELTECSETSKNNIQTSGSNPKERIQGS